MRKEGRRKRRKEGRRTRRKEGRRKGGRKEGKEEEGGGGRRRGKGGGGREESGRNCTEEREMGSSSFFLAAAVFALMSSVPCALGTGLSLSNCFCGTAESFCSSKNGSHGSIALLSYALDMPCLGLTQLARHALGVPIRWIYSGALFMLHFYRSGCRLRRAHDHPNELCQHSNCWT